MARPSLPTVLALLAALVVGLDPAPAHALVQVGGQGGSGAGVSGQGNVQSGDHPTTAGNPGGGGVFFPPPDITGPNDGSGGGGPAGAPTQQPADLSRGASPRAGAHTPRELVPTAGRGDVAAADRLIGSSLVERDRWQVWWEANKFDFITLHRMEDRGVATQGDHQETASERELRLVGVRARLREEVIPTLRELTDSSDALVRAAAIAALGKLRDTGSADLACRMLGDGNATVREAAMLSLGLLTDGRAAWVLMHVADDSATGRTLLGRSPISIDNRGQALLTASLRGNPSASQVLVETLTEREGAHPVLLALAADAAGLMGDDSSLPALLDIAFDRDLPQYARSAATAALGRIGDPSVTPALLTLLDADLEPRRAAAVALGEVAHPRSDRVLRRLETVLAEEPDPAVRHFAAISLGRIGGEQALGVLLGARRHADDHMRPWIALGLGLAGRADPTAPVLAPLLDMLDAESNAETTAAVLLAMGLSRRPDALPVLVAHLETGRQEEVGYAALGLGLSGHAQASAPLRSLLSSSRSPLVLRQAALGLGVLGDRKATPELIALMRTTSNPMVASHAALGIAFIGDDDAVGPLLAIIRDRGPTGIPTTYAAVALGQLFDTDRRPALSRLAAGANHLAWTSAVEDLLSIGF